MNLKPRKISRPALLKHFRTLNCVICGAADPDPAHIRSVGAGGWDIDENIVPLCREHHSLQHSKGWMYMLRTFERLAAHFRKLGWVWGSMSPTGKLYNEDIWPLFMDGRRGLE